MKFIFEGKNTYNDLEAYIEIENSSESVNLIVANKDRYGSKHVTANFKINKNDCRKLVKVLNLLIEELQ